jgi:hypothetical protein
MNDVLPGAEESRSGLHAFSDAHALGCALLREDRLTASLAETELRTLTGAALVDGTALADEVRQCWGSDPNAIAAANHIPVEDTEDDAGYGTTIVFAQYRSGPPGIVLHRPAIDGLDRRLRACGLSELFGSDCTRNMFIAHELYHHFDEGRAAPLCSRHRVAVLRLGPLSVNAPLVGLREIAAGAFAQCLLRLPFHPRALDIVAARGLLLEH